MTISKGEYRRRREETDKSEINLENEIRIQKEVRTVKAGKWKAN